MPCIDFIVFRNSCRRLIAAAVLLVVMAWGQAARGTVPVFVSIPPQQWLVERIGGSLITSHMLVQQGQNPHTFEPTPRQVASLSRAALWFTMGMEFERQLAKKVTGVAPHLEIVDLAGELEKISITGRAEESTHNGHDDHHGVDDHASLGDHDGHHHGDEDPHVWLSPVNLQQMGMAAAEALGRQDPENGQIYRANAQALNLELDRLHRELQELLMPHRGASFYCFHPSFGYFAAAYGLQQQAVEVGGKSPSPRQLGALIARARRDGVKVIFVQPQFDRKSAQAMASAIGGRVASMDALAPDVAANLRYMARQVADALAE